METVERSANRSINVELITNHLHRSNIYPHLIQELQESLCTCKDIPLYFEEHLRNVIRKTGIETKLRNEIYHLFKKTNLTKSPQIPSVHLKEPLDYLRKAQGSWERRISKSLNSVCVELGFPLTRKRNVSEQKEIEEKWNELGVDDFDATQFRPVYAPKDFLDTLCRLRDPNLTSSGDLLTSNTCRLKNDWNLICVLLQSKTFEDLKIQFGSMEFVSIYIGANEYISDANPFRVQAEEHIEAGKKVLAMNYAPLAREYAKTGCPQSVRGDIWCQILGVNINDNERLYYEHLKTCIYQKDLMLDKLIVKDVRLTSSNDNQYFVFEDYLYQVMLLFSRDRDLLTHFTYSSATPLKVVVKDKAEKELLEEVYPPSGIIPFHGFTMLISPLCYLFDDAIKLYYVFRELYIKYLFRLHTINSHPQGILQLSLLVENLLKKKEANLCNHFQKHGIQPLKIVFKWLMRAFSGYLPMEQVLILWDIVLAYDSTEIIAVLAVAILDFRAPVLLQVNTQEKTEVILNDLSSIRVFPLIQYYLFGL